MSDGDGLTALHEAQAARAMIAETLPSMMVTHAQMTIALADGTVLELEFPESCASAYVAGHTEPPGPGLLLPVAGPLPSRGWAVIAFRAIGADPDVRVRVVR
jgi:hypothetical protein